MATSSRLSSSAIASNRLAEDLSHTQQRSQRGPAIDAQAAHADGDRRTFDHKTSGRVLVAEAGEETADEQRDQGVAGGQERRRQRG